MLWQSNLTARDCFVDWDDGTALFHAASGQTHFLNAGTALLLRSVLEAPIDQVAIAAHLREAAGEAAGLVDEQQLSELLRRLEELGLIRSLPDSS